MPMCWSVTGRPSLGSPVLVTAMMSMLFQPGALSDTVSPAQIVFWVAFAGFFFGLTYGLLQIVGELAVFRREYRSGLSVAPTSPPRSASWCRC